MRFFFYSHDGMGLGHVRRHVAIASALVKLVPEAEILLATSVDEVADLGLPSHVDTLKLPGLRKVANGHYAARRLGLRQQEIHLLRAALLGAAVHSFKPDVVLVDKHPLGAGGEFQEGLHAARAAGSTVVLGLRDVLDEPAAVHREWFASGMDDRIAEIFSRILVYGQQRIFDPITAYRFPAALAAMTRFCGYVVNGWPPADLEACPPASVSKEDTRPLVLATTGGGEDGFPVLQEFVAAAKAADWRAVAVTGPLLADAKAEALREAAAANRVGLVRFISSLPAMFDSIDVLVCMGGYNTLAEAAYKGVPTVCVPRVTPRREQLIRARKFEELGLLRTVHPLELNEARLRSEIQAALNTPRTEISERARRVIDFNGATSAAQSLLEVARSLSRARNAPPAVRRASIHSGPALIVSE